MQLTIKQIEKEIHKAEKEYYAFYGELNRILHQEIEDMIIKQVEDFFRPKKIKKSSTQIFDVDFFKDVRIKIEDILNPLRVLSTSNDDDGLEVLLLGLGLTKIRPNKNLIDVYNTIYNITHMLSEHTKKPKTSVSWRKDALEWMKENTGNHIDKHIFTYANKTIDSLKDITGVVDKELRSKIDYRDSIRSLVKEEMIDAVKNKTSLNKVRNTLKTTAKDMYRNWRLIVKTEFQMAKGTATSRCIEDIAKVTKTKTVVCIVDMDDDRVSAFCRRNSRHQNGDLKYFYYDDLMPAGYNLSRKPKDWKNSVPLRHFNCRCWLVYVPPGCKVTPSGSVVELNEGERINIERKITS